MKVTMNERLRDFVYSKGMSVNSMSRILEVSQTTLNQQVNGDCGVSANTLNAIAVKYPNANMRWFLTGEGEMESQTITQNNNQGNNFVGNTNLGGASVESLLEIIKNLQEQNSHLINIIGGMK
jgi:transcriptional regulator with XRE-family HTH domain